MILPKLIVNITINLTLKFLGFPPIEKIKVEAKNGLERRQIKMQTGEAFKDNNRLHYVSGKEAKN